MAAPEPPCPASDPAPISVPLVTWPATRQLLDPDELCRRARDRCELSLGVLPSSSQHRQRAGARWEPTGVPQHAWLPGRAAHPALDCHSIDWRLAIDETPLGFPSGLPCQLSRGAIDLPGRSRTAFHTESGAGFPARSSGCAAAMPRSRSCPGEQWLRRRRRQTAGGNARFCSALSGWLITKSPTVDNGFISAGCVAPHSARRRIVPPGALVRLGWL